MSLTLTSSIAVRRPTLIRVWRTTDQPNTPLTSTWLPTLAPNAHTEGGTRP